MKNHPSRIWPAMSGMNDTDDPDRIPEDELSFLLNAFCDPTGKLAKYWGTYTVTTAEELGVTDTRSKVFTMARFRGKTGQARAVAVVGATFLRSGPNNIKDTWVPIVFPTETSTPALNRAAAIVFRNRYAYHQNGLDLPFRVKMEEDDFSTPDENAEILGLRPPLYAFASANMTSAGTLFPDDRVTSYALTYVYGDRGESGPSYLANVQTTTAAASNVMTGIPLGPTGVTARRLYRTRIGAGANPPPTSQQTYDAFYNQTATSLELFFLGEISNNTDSSFTDLAEDAQLDFSRRLPPPRPMPPIASYQTVHQDHIVWANLREHPWVAILAAMDTNPNLTTVTATVTISNTGNGTITIVYDGTPNTFDSTITISNYKTKTLKEIRQAINFNYGSVVTDDGTGASFNTTARIFRVMAGVDENRTYRFKEVTSRSIAGSANMFAFEAIDDEDDAVVVDGGEYFPNRVMWSNLAFPEEINPLNFVDVSRHDVYPIHGLFRDDYTLGLLTEDTVWLITGSMSVNPETFAPDFSLARSQSEHGNFCTRPDSIAEIPGGVVFVARDGLRLFRGQTSKPFARQIRARLMRRLLVEPRTRDNLVLHYDNGKLFIAFAGMEVA